MKKVLKLVLLSIIAVALMLATGEASNNLYQILWTGGCLVVISVAMFLLSILEKKKNVRS